MLNYSLGSEEATSAVTQADNKSPLRRELLSVFFIVGIIGSILALLHIRSKRNFNNSKQAFMLKCLMTLDLVGLLGMLLQMTVRSHVNQDFYRTHIWMFCFIRVVWRFAGMSSGCVAFIMAIERYFALAKPFFYRQHFTACALITFAPAFGFGIFCDETAKKCERYRDAKAPKDVAYAFLCFVVGTSLCTLMIFCNVSVTRVVNRMQKLTMAVATENSNRSQQSIKLRHQISKVSSSSSTSKSISLVTRDEIKFINMCNLLTASFCFCWQTQMLTIPIAQFVSNANQSGKFVQIFYQLADFLLLIHFTIDPFAYVLLRTNYWLRIKGFLGQLLCRKDDEFAELPKTDLSPDQRF